MILKELKDRYPRDNRSNSSSEPRIQIYGRHTSPINLDPYRIQKTRVEYLKKFR